MAAQFECPKCGGLLDYPENDELFDDYDLSNKDPHYFEDYFGDDLMVTCEWCKKRVEVPFDPSERIHRSDPLKQFDAMEVTGDKSGAYDPWPKTRAGKIVLGIMALVYLIMSSGYGIVSWLVG